MLRKKKKDEGAVNEGKYIVDKIMRHIGQAPEKNTSFNGTGTVRNLITWSRQNTSTDTLLTANGECKNGRKRTEDSNVQKNTLTS